MPVNPILAFTCDKLTPAIAPEDAVLINIKLPASVNYPQGQVLGELTASPGTFAAYAVGNADGSQIPKALLETACQTDASGNITNSNTAGQTTGEFGQTYPVAQAYISGYFRTEELVGLDANAVTKLGFLKRGTPTTGLIHLP